MPVPRVLSHIAPDDFEVTEALRTWAAMNAPLVHLEHETALFLVHEFRQPISNWPLKWKEWILRAQTDYQPATAHTQYALGGWKLQEVQP